MCLVTESLVRCFFFFFEAELVVWFDVSLSARDEAESLTLSIITAMTTPTVTATTQILSINAGHWH